MAVFENLRIHHLCVSSSSLWGHYSSKNISVCRWNNIFNKLGALFWQRNTLVPTFVLFETCAFKKRTKQRTRHATAKASWEKEFTFLQQARTLPWDIVCFLRENSVKYLLPFFIAHFLNVFAALMPPYSLNVHPHSHTRRKLTFFA